MLWCVKTSELTDAVRSFHQDYMSINEAKVNSGHCIVLLRNTRWVYSYSVSRLNDLIHLALYTPLKATLKYTAHAFIIDHMVRTPHIRLQARRLSNTQIYSTYFLLPGKKTSDMNIHRVHDLLWFDTFFFFLPFFPKSSTFGFDFSRVVLYLMETYVQQQQPSSPNVKVHCDIQYSTQKSTFLLLCCV